MTGKERGPSGVVKLCQYWDSPAYDHKCMEPARFRWSGLNLCGFHYGKPNAELGIPKPDEVPA